MLDLFSSNFSLIDEWEINSVRNFYLVFLVLTSEGQIIQQLNYINEKSNKVDLLFCDDLRIYIMVTGVNFIIRKVAQAACMYVTMVISVEDGQLRIQNKGPKTTDHKAHLGTEILITDLMHNPMKVASSPK